MYEEKVAELLIYWLQDALKEAVKGVWTQVPAAPLYPYLHLEMGDITLLPFEHRGRVVFNLTGVSRYPGQKEILSLGATLKTLLNATTHAVGVFKVDHQAPLKLDRDGMTRTLTLQIRGFVPQEINL